MGRVVDIGYVRHQPLVRESTIKISKRCCIQDIPQPPHRQTRYSSQTCSRDSSRLRPDARVRLEAQAPLRRPPICLDPSDRERLNFLPSFAARRDAPNDRATASTLDPRCESPVANVSCARGCLQVEVLCIKVVRKAKVGILVGEEAGREEDITVHQASSGFQAVGSGVRELVKVEQIVDRLVVQGSWSERWKSERKAQIAGSEAGAADVD